MTLRIMPLVVERWLLLLPPPAPAASLEALPQRLLTQSMPASTLPDGLASHDVDDSPVRPDSGGRKCMLSLAAEDMAADDMDFGLTTTGTQQQQCQGSMYEGVSRYRPSPLCKAAGGGTHRDGSWYPVSTLSSESEWLPSSSSSSSAAALGAAGRTEGFEAGSTWTTSR